MLTMKWLETDQELDAVKSDWQWLQENSRNINIFQSYEWITLWWKCFRENKQPKILFVWNSHTPLSVAPFFIEEKKKFGIAMKRVAIIGDRLSSNHEFIFTDDDYISIKMCFDRLIENLTDWDYIELKKLPEKSSTLNAMREMANKPNIHFIEIPYLKYPFMNMNEDSNGNGMREAKKQIKKSLRNSRNRLNKAGGGTILHFDEIVANGVFDEIVQLGKRSWKHRAGVDPITSNRNREFFREICKSFHECRRLSLSALELRGLKVAFVLGFMTRGKYSTYYTVFDEGLHNLLPGIIVISHAIDSAYRNGVAEIDFSEGDHPFKRYWTDNCRLFKEAYLINKESPRYPLILSWLLLRREVKKSPRAHNIILKIKNSIRKM